MNIDSFNKFLHEFEQMDAESKRVGMYTFEKQLHELSKQEIADFPEPKKLYQFFLFAKQFNTENPSNEIIDAYGNRKPHPNVMDLRDFAFFNMHLQSSMTIARHLADCKNCRETIERLNLIEKGEKQLSYDSARLEKFAEKVFLETANAHETDKEHIISSGRQIAEESINTASSIADKFKNAFFVEMALPTGASRPHKVQENTVYGEVSFQYRIEVLTTHYAYCFSDFEMDCSPISKRIGMKLTFFLYDETIEPPQILDKHENRNWRGGPVEPFKLYIERTLCQKQKHSLSIGFRCENERTV